MKTKNSSQPGRLTFEKVLEVFKDYLQQETVYEVVLTSYGYTLMAWNDAREWYNVELMKTPKKLMDGCPAESLCRVSGGQADGE